MRRLIAAWALILAWGLALPAAARAADSLARFRRIPARAQRRAPSWSSHQPFRQYCDWQGRTSDPMHMTAYRSRVMIREVTVDSTAPLTGFDGERTTEGAFAAAHKVFMVPTVKVFNTRGADAGEAIVGMLTPDYYFGYLEAAIDEGLSRVRGK
jgi:hypothetical protein